MQPEQRQARDVRDLTRGGHRRAAGDGESELLVFVRGGDVLVRVRFDARRDADQDRGRRAQLSRELRQSIDLIGRVDDDATDARLERSPQLGDRLVVAVHRDAGRGELGAQGDGQLPAGAHVEVQPFFGDPTRDGDAEKRLPGVEHLGSDAAEGIAERSGSLPEVDLVDDVGGRPVLGGEFWCGEAGDGQDTVHLGYAGRPQCGHQRIDVLGDP